MHLAILVDVKQYVVLISYIGQSKTTLNLESQKGDFIKMTSFTIDHWKIGCACLDQGGPKKFCS